MQRWGHSVKFHPHGRLRIIRTEYFDKSIYEGFMVHYETGLKADNRVCAALEALVVKEGASLFQSLFLLCHCILFTMLPLCWMKPN